MEIEWKQIKLCGKFSLISLKEMYYCFFGLTAPYLLIADSVQSPIVSFTQYCLLASYNLLKERRSVKQVWDKRWNMYPPFLARWNFELICSFSPLCIVQAPQLHVQFGFPMSIFISADQLQQCAKRGAVKRPIYG